MSAAWITILALTVLTAAIRATGPVLLGGRDLPPPVRDVVTLLAPALLAALVVVETVGAPEGGSLDIDERLAGVLAAGGVLYAGGSTLPAIAVAAVVAAALRALT
jgi:branched-subunit amino acid transport protein